MRRLPPLFCLFVQLLVQLAVAEAATPQRSPAQPAPPRFVTVDYTELEKVLTEELKATGTPSAAVAIVSGDCVIYAKGFGVSNVETGAPVMTDMLFRLGSTTKMMMSAALVTREL